MDLERLFSDLGPTVRGSAATNTTTSSYYHSRNARCTHTDANDLAKGARYTRGTPRIPQHNGVLNAGYGPCVT